MTLLSGDAGLLLWRCCNQSGYIHTPPFKNTKTNTDWTAFSRITDQAIDPHLYVQNNEQLETAIKNFQAIVKKFQIQKLIKHYRITFFINENFLNCMDSLAHHVIKLFTTSIQTW